MTNDLFAVAVEGQCGSGPYWFGGGFHRSVEAARDYVKSIPNRAKIFHLSDAPCQFIDSSPDDQAIMAEAQREQRMPFQSRCCSVPEHAALAAENERLKEALQYARPICGETMTEDDPPCRCQACHMNARIDSILKGAT